MAERAVSKSQKKSEQREEKARVARLIEFLRNYGGIEAPQVAGEAATDNQLRSVAAQLSVLVSQLASGTIIDVGAGSGVLLARIAEDHPFAESTEWSYLALEFPAQHAALFDVARTRRVHRRVEVEDINAFLAGKLPRPAGNTIFVVRNVLHELSIRDTAALFLAIAQWAQAGITLVIQDLLSFPKAEHGNVCWRAGDLRELLIHLGYQVSITPEESASGNAWVTLYAVASSAATILVDEHSVLAKVLDLRQRQWAAWHYVGALAEFGTASRDVLARKLDFDLQFAALTRRLTEAGDMAGRLTPKEESVVVKALVARAIEGLRPLRRRLQVPEIPHFKDRANSQVALTGYLTSDRAVAVLEGPALMGKTTLVRHVLSTFHHERTAIFVDARHTGSVWGILEEVLLGLGCKLPAEVLRELKNIRWADVAPTFDSLGHAHARNTILVVDHVERLLQPDGVIADMEVADFLRRYSTKPSAKVVLTSRRPVSERSVPAAIRSTELQPLVARFPQGEHVLNLLSTLSGRTAFPEGLIEATDRHPHLTYLAGLVLRNPVDDASRVVHAVRNHLRQELIKMVVTEQSQPAIEWLSLLQVPVPRDLVVSVAGDEAVAAAEDSGLIVATRDYVRGEADDASVLIRCLEPLRIKEAKQMEGDKGDRESDEDPDNDRQSTMRQRLVNSLLARYRSDEDPRWIREATYQRIATGDIAEIARFGVAYRGEIAAAGEYWFTRRKDYASAEWAFQTVRGMGDTSAHTVMRLAASLVRTGKTEAGEAEFAALFQAYPREWNFRSSYIDSLIHVRRFADALANLERHRPTPDQGWTLGQYGRSYNGLHRYRDAVRVLTQQLALMEEPMVFRSLARAHRGLGDREVEGQLLFRAIKQYPRDRDIRRDVASWMEKNGQVNEAVELLKALFDENPRDALTVYAYVQALCGLDRVSEASELWDSIQMQVMPTFIRPAIHAHILRHRGRFEEAVQTMLASPPTGVDEHREGQISELYVAWARSAPTEEAAGIARRGLRSAADLLQNVPFLVSQAKLAAIAGDLPWSRTLQSRIRKINPRSPDLRALEGDLPGTAG